MRKPNKTDPLKGKASTRNLLLDTAAQFMTERGGIDITFSEIGERSGFNTALVRYYFGHKRGMMFALIERTLKGALERLEDLMKTDLPPEEKLALHIRGMINTYFFHPYVNRLLSHIAHDDDGNYAEKISSEMSAPIIEAQAQILEDGIKSGIFREMDPMLLHIHINGACDALFHYDAILKRNFNVEEISIEIKENYITHISETILNGIRKTE